MPIIRNRKTGKELRVPAGTAENVLNVNAFKKLWEVVNEKTPPPHEVIQFQSKKEPEVTPKETQVLPNAESVERPNYELKNKSFRDIKKNLEYLKEVDLLFLQRDTRKTVSKLAIDELERRNANDSSRA